MKLWANIIKGLKKSKMVEKLKKIRIFKRLRAYKLETDEFIFKLINREGTINSLKNELKELSESFIKAIEEHKIEMTKISDKHEKATKHYAELVKRKKEFLKRLKSKIPDDIVGGGMDTFKYWLAEPFIVVEYTPYIPVNDREVFIDPFSVVKGISDIVKKKVVEDPIDSKILKDEDNEDLEEG